MPLLAREAELCYAREQHMDYPISTQLDGYHLVTPFLSLFNYCACAAAQYHNIFSLVRELGIPWPFTDWTTSGFWSPEGLTTEAPVFSRRPQLPTMLGQFVHTLPLFRSALLLHRMCNLTWVYFKNCTHSYGLACTRNCAMQEVSEL